MLLMPLPERPLPERPFPDRPLPERPFPEMPLADNPIPESDLPDRPFPDRPLPERPFPDRPLELRSVGAITAVALPTVPTWISGRSLPVASLILAICVSVSLIFTSLPTVLLLSISCHPSKCKRVAS